MAVYLTSGFQVSITRACRVVDLPKSMYYYTSVKDDSAVINKLKELSEQKPGEGQDKYYDRIRLANLPWNHKRVSRVYRMMGLHLRRKGKRRIPARVKTPLLQPEHSNMTWSMDFMHDCLMNGRKYRILNILDDYNRKAISVEADFSFPAEAVNNVLKHAIHEYGIPSAIRVDNGPEFLSSMFTLFCEQRGIKVQYIQPGKPMQNGYIERFNGTLRRDFLNANLFESLYDFRNKRDLWLEDYNNCRPHEALGNVPPNQFISPELKLN
jgi:putative transposase